jgi:predicted permease
MRETFDLRFREESVRGARAVAWFLLKNTGDMVSSGLRGRFGPPSRNPHSVRARTTRAGKKRGDGVNLMENLRQDLAFTLRSLTRNPAFSLAALLTIALGIGATTSIFSVVNGILLRPLPYSDQDRLVTIHAASVQKPESRGNMSGPDILDLASMNAIRTLVGFSGGSATLTGRGEARIIPGARVSEGTLSTFGLRPFLGRDLRPEEAIPGAPRSVVVGYGFWQEEMGGGTDVLGQTLQLDGDTYEIVGVAPWGFDFPDGSRLWRPYYRSEDCGRGCHIYKTVGRLADGATFQQAREQAEALALRLDEAFPDSNFEKRFNFMSLEDDLVRDVRTQLWILLAAVGLVLLVACANVANLLLARSQGRMTEVGIRAALGAGRRRLVQQVLTESLALSVLGGAAGLGLTYGGVDVLRRMAPDALPRVDEVTVDPWVLLFALLLSVLVALLFGLTPAVRLARSSPSAALGRSRRGADAGPSGRRARALLLGGEVTLSLILLVGAGLLLRTLGRLHDIDPGFRTDNITRFNIGLPESSYPDLESAARFFETLEERLGSIPGVDAVGSTFGAALGRNNATGWATVEGRPEPEPGEEISAIFRPVTPGYLEAMGIPLLEGRRIEESDRTGNPEVALLNQTLADDLFPGEDPIGKKVRVDVNFGFGSPYRTIVGIVADSRMLSLTQEPLGAFFVPQRQAGPQFLTVAVRSHPGAGPLVSAIRHEVAALDSNLPLARVETMDQVVAKATAPTRFFLTLLGVFAVLAVTLAAVGLYGVATYMVSRRRQEIGIRMALGAHSHRVTRMVIGQTALPVLVGLFVGLSASLTGARVMERLLFEVDPRDPLVYVGVSGILVGVAFLASLLPALQASRVDPGEALRRE